MKSNFNNDTKNIPDSLIYQACPDFDVLIDQDSIRRIWQLASVRAGGRTILQGDEVEYLVTPAEREVIATEIKKMYRRSVARSIIKKQPFFLKIRTIWTEFAATEPEPEPEIYLDEHINQQGE